MTDGRISQATVRAITDGNDLNISQLTVRSVFNYPAEEGRVSQLTVRSIDEPSPSARISQLIVRAIVRGRIDQPRVRAWTFTLDGHDFYVLRLGDIQTLVYDVYSEKWHRWTSPNLDRLRFIIGQNWIGSGSYAGSYGSNIVIGDDTLGILYMFDPEQVYDEIPVYGEITQGNFVRKATGQLVSRQRIPVPCYEVYLTGDSGYTVGDSTSVTLYTSDDNGNTLTSRGTITSRPDDYTQEFSWRSLGQVRYPGRLFVIEDEGALQRINGLDVNIGPEA